MFNIFHVPNVIFQIGVFAMYLVYCKERDGI